MKLRMRIFSSIIFATGLFPQFAQADQIVLGCSPALPFTDSSADNKGFYTELVVAAGQKSDVEIIAKIMPWKRVVALTKSGEIDGIYCPAITEERKAWLEFTDIDFYQNEVGLFVNTKSPVVWKDIADLKNYNVGSLASSSYVKYLANQGIPVKEYSDNETGLKMLKGQRFDAIYDLRIVLESLMRSRFPEMASEIAYSATLQVIHLRPGIRKSHPKAKEIAVKLSNGYRALKADGSLDKILKNAKIQH